MLSLGDRSVPVPKIAPTEVHAARKGHVTLQDAPRTLQESPSLWVAFTRGPFRRLLPLVLSFLDWTDVLALDSASPPYALAPGRRPRITRIPHAACMSESSVMRLLSEQALAAKLTVICGASYASTGAPAESDGCESETEESPGYWRERLRHLIEDCDEHGDANGAASRIAAAGVMSGLGLRPDPVSAALHLPLSMHDCVWYSLFCRHYPSIARAAARARVIVARTAGTRPLSPSSAASSTCSYSSGSPHTAVALAMAAVGEAGDEMEAKTATAEAGAQSSFVDTPRTRGWYSLPLASWAAAFRFVREAHATHCITKCGAGAISHAAATAAAILTEKDDGVEDEKETIDDLPFLPVPPAGAARPGGRPVTSHRAGSRRRVQLTRPCEATDMETAWWGIDPSPTVTPTPTPTPAEQTPVATPAASPTRRRGRATTLQQPVADARAGRDRPVCVCGFRGQPPPSEAETEDDGESKKKTVLTPMQRQQEVLLDALLSTLTLVASTGPPLQAFAVSLVAELTATFLPRAAAAAAAEGTGGRSSTSLALSRGFVNGHLFLSLPVYARFTLREWLIQQTRARVRRALSLGAQATTPLRLSVAPARGTASRATPTCACVCTRAACTGAGTSSLCCQARTSDRCGVMSPLRLLGASAPPSPVQGVRARARARWGHYTGSAAMDAVLGHLLSPSHGKVHAGCPAHDCGSVPTGKSQSAPPSPLLPPTPNKPLALLSPTAEDQGDEDEDSTRLVYPLCLCTVLTAVVHRTASLLTPVLVNERRHTAQLASWAGFAPPPCDCRRAQALRDAAATRQGQLLASLEAATIASEAKRAALGTTQEGLGTNPEVAAAVAAVRESSRSFAEAQASRARVPDGLCMLPDPLSRLHQLSRLL